MPSAAQHITVNTHWYINSLEKIFAEVNRFLIFLSLESGFSIVLFIYLATGLNSLIRTCITSVTFNRDKFKFNVNASLNFNQFWIRTSIQICKVIQNTARWGTLA